MSEQSMAHASPPMLNPETFINRELSTIEFQKRVLFEAKNPDTPLLERALFLSIVGSNLDEFFMVRVASYIQKMKLGITSSRPDGYTPQQLISQIRSEADVLIRDQRHVMRDVLQQLAEENIIILSYDELGETERAVVRDYFRDVIFPVLTPLAVDHARPFPFISNLSLNLGVYLEREDNHEEEFARIKVPSGDILPRLVNLNKVMRRYAAQEIDGHRFLWVEDVIQNHLDILFPGMSIIEAYPFRVLRNTDIDYEQEKEEENLDVMSIIEQSVRERRFGHVVRLTVPKNMSERMLSRIQSGLELHPQAYIYQVEGALGSADLSGLLQVDEPRLRFPSHVPHFPPETQYEDIFTATRRGDFIVHHPYDSFSPVEDFFRMAAKDPDVLAIKATLYRVGKNSPIVQALMEARDNDKQVTVLVELKARFDEENNLVWAKAMEEKGVHVIYGVEELAVKTHAKIALVVRREEDGVKRYLHLGTGNYNASTARVYTDLGLFTSNNELADDANRLFNRLTGYAPSTTYQRLLVAPEYLFDELYSLIENEIQAAKNGREARLIFKMNQLEEDKMIQKLYEASQVGVKVDLIVRGHCCLRPGVPGVSENIRVISVIGRFLEHSRAYYFQNAPSDKQLLLGSADLMRRNLYNRVEVVFPVLEHRVRMKVLQTLATQLLDNQGAWELHANGMYERVHPTDNETLVDSQAIFMQNSFGLDLLP